MITLIFYTLVLALGHGIYRVMWCAPGADQQEEPDAAEPGRTVTEVREHQLAVLLLSGRIDSATYRREMSELAQVDQAWHGDPK